MKGWPSDRRRAGSQGTDARRQTRSGKLAIAIRRQLIKFREERKHRKRSDWNIRTIAPSSILTVRDGWKFVAAVTTAGRPPAPRCSFAAVAVDVVVVVDQLADVGGAVRRPPSLSSLSAVSVDRPTRLIDCGSQLGRISYGLNNMQQRVPRKDWTRGHQDCDDRGRTRSDGRDDRDFKLNLIAGCDKGDIKLCIIPNCDDLEERLEIIFVLPV